MLGNILKHALFWPVTGPGYLIEFSIDKIEGVVREELTDDSQIKADLLELQLLLELGDIDDEEYVRREAHLMQRLREVREWRERFGMGVPGGPVRVAGDSEEVAAAEAAEHADEHPLEESPAADEPDARRGGIASPGGATIDFHLGFDDEPG